MPQKKSPSFGWIVTAIVIAVGIVMAALTINAVQDRQEASNTAVPSMSAGMGKPIVVGESTAPVTMTLFEDYQCPGCKGFENFFGDAKFNAISEGTAKVEYYPVAFLTEGSAVASNAAACAADQGKFTEYHQALFIHQPSEQDGTSFTQDLVLSLGESVGMPDKREFERCVVGNRYGTWVESLIAALEERRIQGTPAAFINGQRIDIPNTSELQMAVLLGLVEAPEPGTGTAEETDGSAGQLLLRTVDRRVQILFPGDLP